MKENKTTNKTTATKPTAAKKKAAPKVKAIVGTIYHSVAARCRFRVIVVDQKARQATLQCLDNGHTMEVKDKDLQNPELWKLQTEPTRA